MWNKSLVLGVVVGSMATGIAMVSVNAIGSSLALESSVSHGSSGLIEQQRRPQDRQPSRRDRQEEELDRGDRDDEDRQRGGDRERDGQKNTWRGSGVSAKVDALRAVLVRKGVVTEAELDAALASIRERDDRGEREDERDQRGRGRQQR
ncbi:MAG: hypothetical protein ACF8GE_10305 [Phycisphaerales bacterium JB043]